MSINILDSNTINKIAAGEVVERPSSVVKELVENAIDAGANAITVEIKDGGMTLIRVTDNGCGIHKEEVKVAFLRHSTSKIKTAADLLGISSLGFRGEALSSISAVSQVELITKCPESLSGVRYRIDGGAEKELEDVGAPDGTTFLVRNLFYNTPARRKFLKTPATEAGYVSSVMEHLCMSHPDISFRFINNNQPKLQTVGNGNLKDVIYAVYGREISANLIEIHEKFDTFSMDGFIGKPAVCRGNRNYENYYINGRYIRNSIVSKAIEEGFAPFIMQHKYPFTAFHITIEPELLDVNVHPSKMELRFANSPYIYDCVRNAVMEALSQKELIVDATLDDKVIPPALTLPADNTNATMTNTSDSANAAVTEPSESVSFTKAVTSDTDDKPARMPEPFETKRAAEYDTSVLKPDYTQLKLFERPELLKEQNKKSIKIIGQVFDTYWIIEFENNMYIIDQHAAHEKVNYERFVKRFKEQSIESQYLNPPLVVTLNMDEQAKLRANEEYFTKYGFEIEPFGGREYCISAVPANLYGFHEEELFLEMLDNLSGEGAKDAFDLFTARLATMACKSAVKGNHQMSALEADKLIDELLTLDNPYNCPHGRPTVIAMTKTEIEKKFKRIV